MSHIVTASSLRLRKGPSLDHEVVAELLNGQVVTVKDQSNSEWWNISVALHGSTIDGYSASRYLKIVPQQSAGLNTSKIPAVHYATNPSSNRQSVNVRHAPLGETNLVRRNMGPGSTPTSKITDVYAILSYLDVERSLRYLPLNNSTFCNIYAYDFLYCAQAYLPRVWWTGKTLIALAKDPGNIPKPEYGKNVMELSANSLYDWLDEWGDDFGWTRTYDLTLLQNTVNAEGSVGVVCAKRKDRSRSGHITCVIPETAGCAAQRNSGVVTAPLQSQAGVKNKKTFTGDWWVRLAQEYSEVGFWWHA